MDVISAIPQRTQRLVLTSNAPAGGGLPGWGGGAVLVGAGEGWRPWA